MSDRSTPGQTVGPFFHDALPYPGGADLVPRGHVGAVRLHGRVLDGAGDPVPDALVEIWQADAAGRVPCAPGSLRRDGAAFTGWGRAPTDVDGRYSVSTVEPGGTAPGAARFLSLTVFARGLLDRLFTRVYLPDQEAVLATDPLWRAVPPDRRAGLVAGRDEHGLVFDVVLQGPGETVFLDFGQ